MTTAASPVLQDFGQRAQARRGLLIGSIMLATLMQAIDTTIANVALPDMQGSLSATQDQVAWVLTSYIVAAAILTPVTGWLASTLGRRRLLVLAVGGFTVASVLCGIATGIGEMVLFRVMQGVFGAALVPISQSLLLDVFPREKHGAAMALWGMGIMVGPILGPPLGGWLTEDFSWRWVFLINVPVGILALFGILASVPKEETRSRPLDWTGFGLLALGIGAMLGMMLVGRLIGRVDARWPIAIGMLLTAGSLHFMTQFGVLVSRFDVVWIGVMQGLGLGLVFVPISSVAYSTLPASQRTEAAGLFSLVRNIGSSIGISAVMTILARSTQTNHAEIAARVPMFGAEQGLLPGAWDPGTVAGATALNAEISRQAAVIAYVNDFWLLMLLTMAALPLVYFLRAGKTAAAGPPPPPAH